MRILGIDPGSRITGWGVLDSDGWELAFVGAGAIRMGPSSTVLAERLCRLAIELEKLLDERRPEVELGR